ncbi:exported hypothetical protein [Candidatus Terasakiella magnetica]|uniref:Solute-binding protein family 3/N-terminal domain-containing protein n=1 Tax=Candidatus Terasakiella magnetica TaxID=1867952 RepID=A0A1C3RF18_9PROT|nr:transporter substrate-binding domain-containing protein [Candidatus Terasakiella magnetica]SCA55883.1 exported hypothetical protein [Candidatus Terasakiella magnetica]
MSILMKNKKLLSLVIYLACILPLCVTHAIAANKPSIVICGTTWGKLSGPSLPNKGFVADLVLRVFQHAGYEAKYEIVPWARCIAGVKELKYDLVASAWHGDEIDEEYNYLNDILIDSINFIVPEGSTIKSGNIESFYGLHVGMVRETTGIVEAFSKEDRNNLNISYTANLSSLPKMLIGKRFDAIVGDPVNLNEVMKEQGLNVHHKLITLQPPLKTNIQAPIISKKHPNKDQIISDFNNSFRILVSEGMYDDLITLHDYQANYPK